MFTNRLNTLVAARDAAIESYRSIIEAAEAESRSALTEVEAADADAIQAQVEKLNGEIRSLETMIANAAAADEARARFEHVVRPVATAKADDDTNELRSMIAAPRGEYRTTVTLNTAFGTLAPVQKGVLSVGDTGFVAVIDKVAAPMHAASIPVGKFSDVSFTATAQGVAITESGGHTNAALAVAGYKTGVVLSHELLARIPEAETRVRNKIAKGANSLINGLVSAAVVGVAGTNIATNDVVAVSDLAGIFYSIAGDVRPEMVWVFDPATMAIVRALGESDSSLLLANLANGTTTLFGNRIYELSLEAPTTDDNVVAALVHPEAITAAISSIEVSRDDSVRFDEDEVYFRGRVFAGAIVNDADYVKTLEWSAA